MIKGFIFDLDGVITDTAELHYLAWKALAKQMNWEFNRTINEKLRGVSRMDSIKLIQQQNNESLSEDKLIELATLKNTIYVDSLSNLSETDYLDGARALLEQLKTEGFKIALGSASKNSSKVLTQLNAMHYFDVIGDGNSVSKSKPAPDIFLYGAKELGLKPKECIVYEDAESGIEAANSGGFYSVGIGPKERVGHANVRFDSMKNASFSAIKQHFNKLF